MKAPEDIFLAEVHEAHMKLGSKVSAILLSDMIKKFTLNCLIKQKTEYDAEIKRLQEAFNTALTDNLTRNPDQ